jgi:hypothetical protein
MEVQGKIVEIFDTVQVSDNFRKREFVIEYADNPQYPEFLKFECIQDKCTLLDEFSVGQEVMVNLNLKGRKWTDPQGNVKYFNSLQAWKIQPAGNNTASQPSPTASSATSASSAPNPNNQIFSAEDESEEDLPF